MGDYPSLNLINLNDFLFDGDSLLNIIGGDVGDELIALDVDVWK